MQSPVAAVEANDQPRQTSDSFYIQMNQSQNQAQAIQNVQGKALGIAIGAMAFVFVCFNTAFIVPDLIYAYQRTQCVKTIPEGFSFDLSTWLMVDAYMRVGMTVLMIIVAITICKSLEAGVACGIGALCILIMYSLFFFCWTIVGSVMFWGKINPKGICYGPVQAYLYAILIITYVSIGCNFLFKMCKKDDFQT